MTSKFQYQPKPAPGIRLEFHKLNIDAYLKFVICLL